MLSDGLYSSPSMSEVDVDALFLSGLTALIQSIAKTHIQGDSTPVLSPSSRTFDSHESDSEIVKEGAMLLAALKSYISLNIQSAQSPLDEGDLVQDYQEIKSTSSERLVPGEGGQVPAKTWTDGGEETNSSNIAATSVLSAGLLTELEGMTLTKTRAHVFNSMPIRLLAFESEGSNIQLIDRNEMFKRILPKVLSQTCTADFQERWLAASHLQDIDFDIKQRHDAMNSLLTEVIERSAQYAILSHTWIRELPGDILFGDWKNRALNPRGLAKIVNFCRAASHRSMALGWADNVCINKESSAELDESIRSMYKWYRGSYISLIYLSETEYIEQGARDSWFTRGWTLQELLAPKRRLIYNRDWNLIGTIDDNEHNVLSMIETATTITKQELVLCVQGRMEDIPISRILQLASRRQVTRDEDSAYSILGLLGVNMPVSYGEGASSALLRLLRELLSTRKNILDLFNRTYHDGDSLLSPVLSRYSQRVSYFDNPGHGSALDLLAPEEPIIATHRGVRVRCILMPCLCSKSANDGDYISKGHVSLQIPSFITLSSGLRGQYYMNMFDTRLYLSELPDLPITYELPAENCRTTMAVVNFGVENDEIIFPDLCMGVPIYTPDRPGAVTASSKITIVSTKTPYLFALSYRNGRIPISELGNEGMQLVTLYL